jgi:gliding motility-associated-like protein
MGIKHRLFFLFILLSGLIRGHAQNCPTLGQNPTSSFPVCGTATFVQNSVPICDGSAIPGPCGAGFADKNPFWYHFSCYISGTLGFLITPNNLGDDYDWQLFDVTGHNPNDVYTDATLFVACNWSGLSGITGASSAGFSLINCAGSAFPLLSSMPNIIAGHDYLLMVSHYTDTQSGYRLSFTMGSPGGGTASITDPANPVPKVTGAIPSCDGMQVVVYFNKPVKCSSLAFNGSDFTISPAVTIISVLGYGCTSSFELDSVALQFAAPLAPGNYTVTAAIGTDGNTLVDNCDRGIAAGENAPFTIAAPVPLPMGTIVPPTCAPVSLTLTFTDPIQCSSVATNGSDFSITGASAATITSAAAVNCNANGETNTINIQLSAPILTAGNYQVNVLPGSDGNTLIGRCNRRVPNGNTAAFTIAPQPPLAMGTVTPPPCTPSSVILTFPDITNCNSIAANGTDFIITGPSAVTVVSAAAVNCTANGETNSITVQFAAPILVTGTYQVQVTTGADGNTLTGNCLRQMAAGLTASFTLAPQMPIAMGTVTPPPCIPQSVTLTFADPIKCASIAANGSDFIITGPSGVTVNSATAVNCDANGETTMITLQFATPILVTGNYQVQVVSGSDGNPLIGQCGRQVTAGLTTPFTLATQPPLPIGTITQPSCSPSSIVMTFPSTDALNCFSVAANGTDFIITGPSPVTIVSAGASCNTDPNFATVTIQLSAPVTTSGTYQLQVVTGTDGNTITGACNRKITAGDFTTFTIPDAPPVPMGTLSPAAIGCSPSSLRLIFAAPVRCSSIAANGSDFVLTGPSAVTISSATGTCDANGLTTTIDLQLSSPIVVGGNYQLQLAVGSDGNTLLSDCNRQTPVIGSAVNFIASDTVSAAFQYIVQYGCQTDGIDFSHDGQHNVNQWAWTINGAPVSNAQTFTQSFSASSNNQVQLNVSNGVCTDTYAATIVLNNKVTIGFEAPDILCPGDTAIFIDQSKGPVDTWQWNFGNGNTSIQQVPPGQVYPSTGIETLYTVTLTAGNTANGCLANASQTVKILSSCIIAVPSAFTPNNDGLNDYLFPLNALKAENLDFKVFNRWGQLVFHSTDWKQKWDGKIKGIQQATNVYIWTLDYTLKDTRQKYSLRGTTTLIRE